MLSKRICKQCHKVYRIERRVVWNRWDEHDDEQWRLGSLACPFDEVYILNVNGEPPEKYPFALEQLMAGQYATK